MINSKTSKAKIHRNGYNKGIALFIAMLVSGVALVIGVGVMEISVKEIKLSSVGRESTKAFYSADTGFECALYWDDAVNSSASSIFATSSDSVLVNNITPHCASTDIYNTWSIVKAPTAATTTFVVNFSANVDDPCVNVTVAKYQNSSGGIVTKIESRGLNSCNNSNTRRSERGVSITY